MSQSDQFLELTTNIRYGLKKVKCGKWNKADYYNYMADFFDYIKLPKDAEEHRAFAKVWEVDNLD